MQTSELMSREPRAVRVGDRLDAAARVLWEQDCGIVPVVDSAGVVVGVLTDRDLCMAVYTQGRSLSELGVTTVMSRLVRACRPDDSIQTAMAAMRDAQVHRLPVVDARGVLVGILAMNDLVRAAQSRPASLDAAAVVKCLAGIGAPRRQAPAVPVATAKPVPAIVPTPVKVGAVAGTSATSNIAGSKAATAVVQASRPQPAAAKAKAKPKKTKKS